MRTVGVLATLLAVSWPVSVRTDVLELKSGQKLEGQYAGGSRDEVRFQVGSQTLRFPLAEVSRLTIGSAAQGDFQRAAKDALRQLKALASVTAGGTTYQLYSARVEDAKVKIDQFLDEFKPSPAAKFTEAVADSMGFYVAASSVWNAKVSRTGYENLTVNPCVLKCPPMLEGFSHDGIKGLVPGDLAHGMAMTYRLPLLWECARNALLDAEKALSR